MNFSSVDNLASIIDGYRNDQGFVIDGDHVQRWISQFERTDRQFVLDETASLFTKTYLQESTILTHLKVILNRICSLRPESAEAWKSTTIVQTQQQSASQLAMNVLALDLIEEEVGIRPQIGESGTTLLYIDDISGTANQMRREVELVLNRVNPQSTLFVIHIVSHRSDYQKRDEVLQIAAARGISVVFRDAIRAENRRTYSANSHVLYPAVLSDAPFTSHWVKQISTNVAREALRIGTGAGLFSSAQARDRYEAIMLEKGAYICSLPEKPNYAMKPLGYKTYRGFGFGMLYLTSRNCPNNCPLPWWWGDCRGLKPTLREWYPLVERRPREDNDPA